MTRAFAALSLAAVLAAASFAQSTSPPPTFEIADVHTSPRRTSSAMRSVVRDGRYELRNATMVDLIRTAYSVDADKVLGGPNWLGFDRFDVIAKIPSKTSQETLKLMLQALLADRFKLVVHNDTKPIPGFVLTLGKGKPKLKEPEPSAKTGCERGLPTPIAPAVAGGQISVPLVNISCHNTTMETFASSLRGFAPDYLTNAVVDSTQLKGSWDFDLKWTSKVLVQFVGPDGITLFDAIDKQLGLKLEEQKLPTPVIMVDRVNKKPTDNPSDIEVKLPPLPPPEFEVADIKPTIAGAPPAPFALGFQPGGRVNLPRFPLRLAISIAWNLSLNNSEIVGAPKCKPDNVRGVANSTPFGPLPLPARLVTCQNITMAQFADQLQIIAAQYVRYPVLDATGLDGAWDFSFTFSAIPPNQLAGLRGVPPAGLAAGPNVEASDPVGGTSFFEAVEKQLGLKLEVTKRPYPVFVIDHIEEKPTDN